MRTTLTIDDDVQALLEEEMRRGGLSLKEAVNQALRFGLTRQRRPERRFVVNPLPVQLPPGLSYDNVEELIEHLEGPSRR